MSSALLHGLEIGVLLSFPIWLAFKLYIWILDDGLFRLFEKVVYYTFIPIGFIYRTVKRITQ